MKRRRPKYSITGSNIRRDDSIKTIPGYIDSGRGAGRREAQAQIDAELREQAEAPLRAADAKRDELLQEIAAVNAELKTYYGDTPLSEMTLAAAPADILTAYELVPEGTLPPLPLEFAEKWKEAADEFTRLVDAKGIVFSNEVTESGQKFWAFLNVQAKKLDRFALTVVNFYLAFKKFHALGLFNGHVAGVDDEAIPSRFAVAPPLLAKPQAPVKTQEQLDAERFDQVSTLTREGDAESRALASKGWAVEVQRLYMDWALNNMSAVWGIPYEKMVSPEVIDWVGDFFERHNLNPLRADSYDKARRALDANYNVLGTVPGSLLLASEKLAASIENSDTNDREVRQNINRRIAEIARATNPRMM